MASICLVNSYNYSNYLGECLTSVFSQTLPFDRVILVDDGSTDDSPEIIRSFCDKYPRATAIYKDNGGQLSSFNAARDLVSDGDQIFLIDSDDFYPNDYHQLIMSQLTPPWDISFCEMQRFTDANSLATSKNNDEPTRCISMSSAMIRKRCTWLGASTSAISVSGRIYRKILPYPNEEDFRIRADDVLVYASSIIGAKKFFIPSLKVGWREHQSNNTLTYIGKDRENEGANEVVKRLFQYYCKKYSLPLHSTIFEVIEELNQLSAEEREYAIFRLGHLLK